MGIAKFWAEQILWRSLLIRLDVSVAANMEYPRSGAEMFFHGIVGKFYAGWEQIFR